MIINLRGTHGSGKSTIVRNVMRRYAEAVPEFIAGRRRPIGYRCALDGRRDLRVIGHYETPCGGCDTIPSVDAAYEQIQAAAASGHHVLYEGIIIGHDVRRCAELRSVHGYDVTVILLTTPLEDCLQAARDRRVARGDRRELGADNFEKRAWAKSLPDRMAAAGVTVHYADRAAAAQLCYEAFGITDAAVNDERDPCCSTPQNTLF